MDDTLELCRWTYNEVIAIRMNAYEQESKSLSYYDTKKLLPGWKEEQPELKEVHSQVLQEVVCIRRSKFDPSRRSDFDPLRRLT
jgi:putative transposase